MAMVWSSPDLPTGPRWPPPASSSQPSPSLAWRSLRAKWVWWWHGPLTRYTKLRVAHAPGMTVTFSPPPRVSDPGMHHGTCVTHVTWCLPGSLTSGFFEVGGGENVPGIPGACATRNFAYLVRDPSALAMHDVNVSLYTCTLYHPNQSSIVPVQAFNQWRHSFTLKTGLPMVKELNAFRPGDSNMRDWHWSSMVQAMAWRLSAPSHSRTSVNVLPTIRLRLRLRQGFIQHKITYESFTSGLHCKTIRTFWTNMNLA